MNHSRFLLVPRGDLLFRAREGGGATVLRVGSEGMELLSRNEMYELVAPAPDPVPVPVNGKLPLPGEKHLCCFGE